jgi:hypothetical protein
MRPAYNDIQGGRVAVCHVPQKEPPFRHSSRFPPPNHPSHHHKKYEPALEMSSSEGKRQTGPRLPNFLKWAKSLFRRKNTTLTLSASSSSGAGARAVPVAEIAEQKGSSASEVKNVNDDSDVAPASPPSTSNAPEPAATTDQVAIAVQKEIKVVHSRPLEEVNVEVRECALTTEAQTTTPTEPTEDDEIEADAIVSSDVVRTLERYKKAVERIKKALELRRESWETFELSGFDSLPHCDEQDIANLQLQIDKVLESRLNTAKNPTKWKKSKHVLEQCFRALAPFMKNVLSVALNAAQVLSTMGISD